MEIYTLFVNYKLIKIYKKQKKAIKDYNLAVYIAKLTHETIEIHLVNSKDGIIKEYSNNYEKNNI